MRYLSCLLVFFIMIHAAYAGQTIYYYGDSTELEGYWAVSTCENSDSAPIVLVIYQWMGLTDYERMRADMLAENCYNAFAIDIYGKGIRPQNIQEAGKQASLYKNDPDLARKRTNAALAYTRNNRDSGDTSKVAALGYCFGGTMALELARSGSDVSAIISFHGGLSSNKPVTEPNIIIPAIQVHHGAADPHVPAKEVQSFKEEMETAQAELYFSSYANAVHAFTQPMAGNDPSSGAAYNETADKISWKAMLAFLQQKL